MSRNILLVKLSSMGDVIHSFPALTDAANHGYRFDWVVEEAFVDLAAMHPAVDKVIPFGLRRWRKRPLTGFTELRRFVRNLRRCEYPRVLDAQGLLKSALVTRASGAAERIGLDANSAREPTSARFYTESLAVSWDLHAIDRLRQLFADALGYAVDLSVPPPLFEEGEEGEKGEEKGLTDSCDQIVLVHGTTWPSKEYPEVAWRTLVLALASKGYSLSFLSGSATEYERAQRLCFDAKQQPIARVKALQPGTLISAAEQVRAARLVIGVDSGLTHLAAVLGRPTIGLYGPTSALRTGVRGLFARDLASEFSCAPCLQRECQYAGPPQLLLDEPVVPACFSELTADLIVQESEKLMTEAARAG